MAEQPKEPLTFAEIVDRFQFEYDKARNIASDQGAVLAVKARVVKQMGVEVLVAVCPKCGNQSAITEEGKHLCNRCHTWLDFKREE